jgi:nucleoside-diphosphate-sugar epimerase
MAAPTLERKCEESLIVLNRKTGTAAVVGATGIIGRAIVAKLAELGGWRVLGVTRSGGTVKMRFDRPTRSV